MIILLHTCTKTTVQRKNLDKYLSYLEKETIRETLYIEYLKRSPNLGALLFANFIIP